MSRPEQALLSRTQNPLSYRGLLALPGARQAFGAAAVARLSFGMAGLSLLLLVHQATGSFAFAGTASGAYALGTVTAPLKARLMDRRGQRAVLPVLGTGAAVALVAMVLLARAGYRGPAAYIGLACLSGAMIPPVGAVMRALWSAITGGGQNTEKAYSLDAATEETLFTAGPLATGLLVTAAGPVLPLLITAALLASGCCLLGVWGTVPVPRAPHHARIAGPLAVPAFRVLLGIVLATSLGLGAIDVTVTARAVSDHHPGAAGYILAALSLGGAVGGLTWGKLRHRSRTSSQMTWLLVAMAAGIALAAVTPDLLLAGLVLAVTGTVLAPATVLSYLSADRLAGLAGLGGGAEASTWINTAWNAGVAAGAALTGLAVDQAGLRVPMFAGTAVLLCAAAAVLARRDTFDEVRAVR
jgi:predicted MFS family arabinose efflux permease